MGLFGALTTSVAGLKAQSFALQNISGNIANSQTTAFKRIDTSFEDLIPDAGVNDQQSGSVETRSEETNNVQGDVQTAAVSTYMAINGDGFFIVQQPGSVADGQPVFSGVDNYTRRGDFTLDKNGYLVNGAGYYLEGIPIDSTTGNVSGSTPQVLKFGGDFLPAQPTTTVTYNANLAKYPLTAAHDTSVPGSELLGLAGFVPNPGVAGEFYNTSAVASGVTLPVASVAGNPITGGTFLSSLNTAAAPASSNQLAVGFQVGDVLKIGANTINFVNGGGTTIGSSSTIDLSTGTMQDLMNAINTAQGNTGSPLSPLSNVSAGTVTLDTGVNSDMVLSANTVNAQNAFNALGFNISGATPAKATGTTVLTAGITDPGTNVTFTINGQTVTLATGTPANFTLAGIENAINNTPGVGVTASDDGTGHLVLTSSLTGTPATITTAGMAAAGLGIPDGTVTNGTGTATQTITRTVGQGIVTGNGVQDFVNQTISGQSVTAYDVSGSPVSIQFRWAKVNSAADGGSDTWNLFYQVNSNATGTQAAWQNVGQDFTFGANGQMNPAVPSIDIGSAALPAVIDGVTLKSPVTVNFGLTGLTQFSDQNGNVSINTLNQNGYPAGSLQSVSIGDNGRVIGNYSNGRNVDLAQITLATFNGTNFLKRIDGGAFEVTDESGPALLGKGGTITGSSLESSNADIADEFTKLIVTQQAYSANTKVITTANQMSQDLLNVIR